MYSQALIIEEILFYINNKLFFLFIVLFILFWFKGCILNRSMYNKHTIKALNGVSLCCSFCALISFVSTVSTTIIFFFVFYAPWYVLWAGHY